MMKQAACRVKALTGIPDTGCALFLAFDLFHHHANFIPY
jgi:hypothetical protein